jgi:glyoxylate/hydroxypyruvate reductase A
MTEQTFAEPNVKLSSEGYGAVLFYSDFDDPKAWGDALSANIPGLDFRVYPDVGNPDDIRHILAWKAYPSFFEPFRNLAQVVNLGAGVDALVGRNDLPDVPISRLSDQGMVALMKSYVLFSVIRYARDIPSFEQAQRRREWHYIHPRPLHQIKIGVMGLGHLGTAVALGLAEAGFDVRGWDHVTKTIEGVKCHGAADDRNVFLSELEILVNMMPLTPGTSGLINGAVFNALPRGAKFVNASRGPVVNETALIDALRSGQIGGATLDVFCVEPLPADHPFWGMENVLITPHLASITVPEAAARDVAESIRRVSAGGEPLHRVDPHRGY